MPYITCEEYDWKNAKMLKKKVDAAMFRHLLF